ncbi:mannose-1-phosphate guanylyltransferase/mannose-6-phosphate isomerase [Pseudomonas sp. HK3]
MALYPVILAGGVGSRLWPLSRQNHPKQFLDLLGCGDTLLQSTIKRAQACSAIPPLMIANKDHRFLLQHQIAPLGLLPEHVLLEPGSRNTTSAISIACLQVIKQDPNGVVLILPADHYLPDVALFANAIAQFIDGLAPDKIGLIGIKPRYGATQYGYMAIEQRECSSAVERFIEKPNKEVAQQLCQQANVAWNSGVVVARAATILNALSIDAPEILKLAEQSFLQSTSLYDFKVMSDDYLQIDNVAFDVSVLEKSTKLVACMLDQEWDDLGSWSSLLAQRKSLGVADYNIFADGQTTLAFNADDMVLVKNDDVILMAHQDSLMDMTSVSNYLKAHNLQSLLNRIDVHRPWGRFKVLAQEAHFIVKQLIVFPNSQISLQSHEFRRENWVVVKGRARIQLNDKEFELGIGESISIDKQQKHRLHNPYDEPLEIIEVQSGDHLDENDIIRYDDQYERHINNT